MWDPSAFVGRYAVAESGRQEPDPICEAVVPVHVVQRVEVRLERSGGIHQLATLASIKGLPALEAEPRIAAKPGAQGLAAAEAVLEFLTHGMSPSTP